jgi:hypothetical protein
MKFSWFVACLVGISSLTSAASALDKQACYDMFESGQKQAKKGQMRDAIESFQACGRPECPNTVQPECVKNASELQRTVPTVTLSALDERGKDLFDVRILIDSKLVASKLDGKAIAIDPGRHVIRFEITGREPIQEEVLIREGEKNRPVSANWSKPAGEKRVGDESTTSKPTPSVDSSTKSENKSETVSESKSDKPSLVPPIVVMSVGAVTAITGLVIWLTAPSLPPECKDNVCSGPGISKERAEELASTANSNKTQTTVGPILLVGGGVVLAAGAVWLGLSASHKSAAKTEGLRVQPLLGLGSIGLLGTF